MGQKTGELIGNLIVLGCFIYLSLILSGKIKSKKSIKSFENPTMLIKLVIYGGVVIFTILTIINFIN